MIEQNLVNAKAFFLMSEGNSPTGWNNSLTSWFNFAVKYQNTWSGCIISEVRFRKTTAMSRNTFSGSTIWPDKFQKQSA
jgi:hypothetical protein